MGGNPSARPPLDGVNAICNATKHTQNHQPEKSSIGNLDNVLQKPLTNLEHPELEEGLDVHEVCSHAEFEEAVEISIIETGLAEGHELRD